MPRGVKRVADMELTGGSGDVNPQTMIIVGSGAVAGAAGVQRTTIGLPIPRLPTPAGKSLVMEILWVEFVHRSLTAAAGATAEYHMSLTTNPAAPATIQAAVADPRTVADWNTNITATAAPASFWTSEGISEVDLTDQAGHGFLVATDNLFLDAFTSGPAAAAMNVPVCRIGYRFKLVSLQEYIGIVQAQQ